MRRCIGIAGRTVGELAALYRVDVPPALRHARGFIGRLLEQALGTDGRARAAPDFPALAVELKSIPIDAHGRPRQATRVCQVPAAGSRRAGDPWERSRLRGKLACVLWIPVQSEPDEAVAAHRIGNPLLRHLPRHEETVLRADWEEFMDHIVSGRPEAISPEMGMYLQVRRAAGGDPCRPARNFYLRTRYTRRILREPPAPP